MPNHVTSKLYIQDENIRKEVIDYLYNEEDKIPSFMTFEKIIPMPDYIYRGNLSKQEKQLYGSDNCWYDWSINNWGTKWDAYNSFIDSQYRITFDTAWSGVPKLMGLLSQKFPGVIFDYKYADEDAGYNVDHYRFNNGRILKHYDINPWSYSAYKTYIDCKDLQDYYKIYMNNKGNATLVHPVVINKINR